MVASRVTMGRARRPGIVDRLPRGVLDAFGVLVFAGAYFGVRALTHPNPGVAMDNAEKVHSLERMLRLPTERSIQELVVDHQWIVNAANWVYVWGHWPVIAGALFWLSRSHRAEFARIRNAMLISGAIGVVIFALFPVAPPRLAGYGLVDTVSEYSSSYRVLQPPSLANLYAAMPSLHVGWDLLIGIALWRCGRHRITRAAGIVLPVLMWIAVVVTANHYLLDGLAGDIVALTGLHLATWWAVHRAAYQMRATRPAGPTLDFVPPARPALPPAPYPAGSHEAIEPLTVHQVLHPAGAAVPDDLDRRETMPMPAVRDARSPRGEVCRVFASRKGHPHSV